MKQGSPQSAVAFITMLVLLSAGARLLRPDPPPVVPADVAGVDLTAYRARAQRALDAQEETARPLAKDERIAVNRAGATELARLPGVGPALAARIVAERKTGGGFHTSADLLRVPGIGESTARKLAKHLDFSGASPAAATAAKPSVHAAGPRLALPPPASRYDLADPEAGGRSSGRPEGRQRAVAPVSGDGPDVLDLNRADAGALQRLHGIGPALARRIIAYRDSVGAFRAVDELVKVPGIGPATLKRLRAHVRVGGRR